MIKEQVGTVSPQGWLAQTIASIVVSALEALLRQRLEGQGKMNRSDGFLPRASPESFWGLESNWIFRRSRRVPLPPSVSLMGDGIYS